MANSIITVYRRQALCQYTAGAIPSIAPINRIKFGSGGADAGGQAVAPSPTQADLTTPITTGGPLNDGMFPIDTGFPTFPLTPPTTARYQVTIPAAQLGGQTINEAALVDSAGNVHAIQTMANKIKDAGVTFTFTFDDVF